MEYPTWNRLSDNTIIYALSHEIIEAKSTMPVYQMEHGIEPSEVHSPFWHVTDKFNRLQLDIINAAGYNWTLKDLYKAQTESVEEMYRE
jgi:hypothetical protein